MRVIDYKKIDMTDAEYNYYQQLVVKFTDEEKGQDGNAFFRNTFETDENGYIMLIKTEKSIPWAVLFFLQNLMVNQRMRLNDSLIEENKKLVERNKNLIRRLEKHDTES